MIFSNFLKLIFRSTIIVAFISFFSLESVNSEANKDLYNKYSLENKSKSLKEACINYIASSSNLAVIERSFFVEIMSAENRYSEEVKSKPEEIRINDYSAYVKPWWKIYFPRAIRKTSAAIEVLRQKKDENKGYTIRQYFLSDYQNTAWNTLAHIYSRYEPQSEVPWFLTYEKGFDGLRYKEFDFSNDQEKYKFHYSLPGQESREDRYNELIEVVEDICSEIRVKSHEKIDIMN